MPKNILDFTEYILFPFLILDFTVLGLNRVPLQNQKIDILIVQKCDRNIKITIVAGEDDE